MTGKFEWFNDKAGKWRWHLLAGNGQIIATSQAYRSKQACMDGIDSVRRNAPGAPVIEHQPEKMLTPA